MAIDTVHLPCYTIGEGCYKNIAHEARYFGKNAVVIGGKTAMAKAKEKLLAGVKGTDIHITDFIWYGGNATYENGDALIAMPEVQKADILFGVGGGRAVDTVKYVADKLDKPMFSFPTLASNCAAVSSISVMYNPDGSLRDYYFPKMANHTFIESSVILDSPRELLWAGIGDTLAKECEAVFGSSEDELSHTPRMGVEVSHVCTEPILKYGKQALEDQAAGKVTHAFEEVVLDIIVSTGIVSNLVTHLPEYYYNSCLAHCFYNGSTLTHGGETHLHGEIVSFGALMQLLYAGEQEMLDRVAKFNLSVGLPVSLADMEITEKDLDVIADRALLTTEWKFKPKNKGITRESFYQLMLDTDAYGKKMRAAEA